jgi:hypothetical protein
MLSVFLSFVIPGTFSTIITPDRDRLNGINPTIISCKRLVPPSPTLEEIPQPSGRPQLRAIRAPRQTAQGSVLAIEEED